MKQSSKPASSKPKLVFFGSGPVGRATLEALLNDFEIEAIITKPRRRGHRSPMPVLEFAKQHNVPFYTPSNRDELALLFKRQHFSAPLGLVVDYGLIIPGPVIGSFALGIANSHFSLLPAWRGADPITFAVLGGQKQTGVSLMLINERLDEGELLAQAELKIDPAITTSDLTRQLVMLSNRQLRQKLPLYIAGKLQPFPQPAGKVTYSRRLTKEDGVLDLTKSAQRLEREVRAYDEWPKSSIELLGHRLIVTQARVAKSADDGELVVKAKPGWLEIQQLRAPSGRLMSGSDFLRGYKK